MMKRIAVVIAALCSSAAADVYRFPASAGHMVRMEHSAGCGSPEVTRWLTGFVDLDMKVDVVPDRQMVVITPAKGGGTFESKAATTISTVGEWHHMRDNGARITVIVDVEPYGASASKPDGNLGPQVRVSVVQRYAGSECHEAWQGAGERL